MQVLCPMNRGGLGARSLNIALQAALNPPGERRVERFGWTFCPGDKVMQVANDYERDVFNGDLGVITGLDLEEAELTVSFEGREVVYGFGELDELVLAYATTIHKSQGSEYPAVVIPLTTQHYTMLARNLLYTGVTRGKRLVVLIGQRRALAIAVKNGNGRRRWSKLREWLAPETRRLRRLQPAPFPKPRERDIGRRIPPPCPVTRTHGLGRFLVAVGNPQRRFANRLLARCCPSRTSGIVRSATWLGSSEPSMFVLLAFQGRARDRTRPNRKQIDEAVGRRRLPAAPVAEGEPVSVSRAGFR